jgi:apolipoprotein N-acyltransferase
MPVVRVANTGISAVVDAQGNVVETLPLGVQAQKDVMMLNYGAKHHNLYAQYGLKIPLLIGFFSLMFIFCPKKRQPPRD